MRIVTWNCNMAFARKSERILAMQPDILVLQECAERDIACAGGSSAFWVGRLKNKGLGVVVYGGRHAQLDRSANMTWPWFLPVQVDDLRILAVWACHRSNTWRYVRVAHRMLDSTETFLAGGDAIAIGDFNSNAIFDSKHGKLTHTVLTERLSNLGMASAYHTLTGEGQGEERQATQFMYRHANKPFHLDYIFATTSMLNGATMTVGDPSEWLQMSDHMPVVLETALPSGQQVAGSQQ